MKVHIYRPSLFGFKIRKFNFYDEEGNKLFFLSEDTYKVLEDPPKQLKVKVDWFSGKTQPFSGDEIYLIVHFEIGSIWQWINPSDCKKYFQFTEVSKAEFEAAIESSGESLQLSKKVSKSASITSRLLSLFMLAFVGILFYYTDYAELPLASDQIDFLRLLALIIGFGSIANLITNSDRRSSPYPKVFLLLLLSVYTYWHFNASAGIDATALFFPALLAIAVSGFYALGEMKV